MNQLDEVLKEFSFSEEFKNYVKDSTDYRSYSEISDDIELEIEQQKVVSTNNFLIST